MRSGKQDIVERQDATPNAKFCLKPLRAPTEEGANIYTSDLSVPKIVESFLGGAGGGLLFKEAPLAENRNIN